MRIKIDKADQLLLSKDYGVKRYFKKGIIKKCLICGNKFYVRPSQIDRKKFCSKDCFFKGKKPKPKIGKFLKCNTCGKMIWIRPHNFFRKLHFCSRECVKNYNYNGKIELKCKICGGKYYRYKSEIKYRGSSFCSMNCHQKYKKSIRKSKSIPAYKKRLWLIFSKYIRQRDEGVCISCGKKDDWKNMDAGHYIPKSAGMSLYFDEKNVNCQCRHCNRFMHGNLSQYALALKQKYGDNILEELEYKRRMIVKFTENDYFDLIKYYKKKLADLKI